MPLKTQSTDANYCATISVPTDVATARAAIFDDMHIWWTNRAERTPSGVTVRFNNSHASFAFDAENPLTWLCTDAHMIINDYDPAEWIGTRLRWGITQTQTGCDITLEHVGLNANLACLDVCTRGWESFFEASLKAHLSGGTPAPETK
ncbi:hypothetical protein shim_13780 [Shimia sp. SK013]|uniref:hypothetical protein n=1 Tax=Shimia sp. SK013 TaxID=1389006 RepID=UPI0006CC9135|nr:hypothetical protein [Shimia sp. SK013]KPA23084.1 hypothetical protein shim_13780 [Shimia sp. SK013]